MRLSGKRALITGASRNIGREVALTFAREGADLLLNAHTSGEELEAVAAQCRELGVNARTVLADVSNSAQVTSMVEDGIETLDKIDILVSNVAIRPHKPILEVSEEEMAPYNVRANMVNPGATDTERRNPEWYPEFRDIPRSSQDHLNTLPMGREATVQDVASACLFFASDESAYITGDRLNVVGGRWIV